MNLITYVYIIISFLSLLIFVSMFYFIPILFVRRFHNSNNIITVNISMTITFCALYYIIYCLIIIHMNTVLGTRYLCNLIEYIRVMMTCQTGYVFITASIYRYGIVIYHSKIFFKKKRWIIICIVCQWIISILVSLPIRSGDYRV
jgi:hypothetical protein